MSRIAIVAEQRMVAECLAEVLGRHEHDVVVVDSWHAARAAEVDIVVLSGPPRGASLDDEGPCPRLILVFQEDGQTDAGRPTNGRDASSVSKAASIEQLLACLDGERDPRALASNGVAAGRQTRGAPAATPLTAREQQVLGLLARGVGTRQIAGSLDVSYATARTHIQNLLMKLGVHSRVEAVALAFRSDLVTFD